jgi:hypothetical protein
MAGIDQFIGRELIGGWRLRRWGKADGRRRLWRDGLRRCGPDENRSAERG